ncbi:MAG: YicC family protein [Saprospiraceae bacterium]|nr:YicC family protein [Saprospiraceae bacterium]
MTSYGRASGLLKNQNISVEIKTLNSKFVDLRLKLPAGLQEFEMEIRKILHDKIFRGKIEANFSFENQHSNESYTINEDVFTSYFDQLQKLAAKLNLDKTDLLSAIIRLPEVVITSEAAISEEEWKIVRTVVEAAIENLTTHRLEEGAAIEKDMRWQIAFILEQLQEIIPFENERIDKVRQRMSNSLEEYLSRENVDENRFEQEVLFYLEKIDITEEKVRLQQHCDYFLQEMDNPDPNKGRKLNFISQEMGREINTLGAKAYSSDIQRFVVMMKDALEKIKEQLANVV